MFMLTMTVHHEEPSVLRELIEHEAGNSASWLRDNRLCVAGDKSKLMVIGTKQLKSTKELINMQIVVDGTISESSSEKLLGIILNNELTWRPHLY